MRQKELNTSRTVDGICMAKPFNLARIDSTQTIIGAQSLWKKVCGYCCLYYYIYYNPRFKLCTMCVKVARRRKRRP